VTCYATEYAVRIVNSFITILATRNYNPSQLFLTLLRVYTAYNLTRQYSILDVFTYTLDIFTYSHFPFLSPIENPLFELTLKTDFLDIPGHETLNRTSVTVAWKGYLPIRIAATSQVSRGCYVTRGNAKVI
jgi:hypothetical protein